jgi:hypothetical protein
MKKWLMHMAGNGWFLACLTYGGPMKPTLCDKYRIPALRERGLIEPAHRIVGGWQVTAKGRQVVEEFL